MLSCSRQVGRDMESWCYPGQSLIGAQVRRATWLIAFWQQKLISQNTLKSVKICIYDVESSRQSAMVEKLYNFSDCNALRMCFLWLVGRVETVQKIMFFPKYKWWENGVSMNNEPDRHHDKCLPVLKPMPLVENTRTQLHKYTNTQIHDYTKNTQMSSSFETYHPGPPEEFLPRIKTGDS